MVLLIPCARFWLESTRVYSFPTVLDTPVQITYLTDLKLQVTLYD